MVEVRHRQTALADGIARADAATGQASRRIAAEFCYLQLRKICELLGIAALVAHNQIPQVQSDAFSKEWNGERIMARLGQLSEHAFMVPVRAAPVGDVLHFEAQPHFLDRAEVRRIFNRCGAVLHSGSLAAYLKDALPTHDMADVKRWASGLVDLLRQHSILLPGGGSSLSR